MGTDVGSGCPSSAAVGRAALREALHLLLVGVEVFRLLKNWLEAGDEVVDVLLRIRNVCVAWTPGSDLSVPIS